MKYREWKIPHGAAYIPESLTSAGYTPLLAAVLAARGMTDPEQAGHFLNGGAEQLEDPLLLAGMPQAVERLAKAARAGEKVTIYGDYDVDGITSACLLSDYLKSLGLECEVYIPDRIEEGYGLNTSAIEAIHGRGVGLIVTVDCGVTALEEAAFASGLGIDMIITDHHELSGELPEAVAVINPKRPDCGYPSQDLAGVGVAFKLVCAMDGDCEKMLGRYGDLVAVGTIADVMPLTGENRYMIKAGLEKLAGDPRPGLAALLEESGMGDRQITATNIGFTVAPRLNAAGRLGKVSWAVRLLTTQSATEAKMLAEGLCRLNKERQELELKTWTQAIKILGSDKPATPIVLAGENWHQGVVGIAASRLAETYSIPAIMISFDGDRGRGSCRSFGGFNIFEALNACAGHLEGFGGHALAAGLNIRREKVDDFRRAIGEYYLRHPPEREPCLELELRIDSPELLEMRCVESLERLEPCGNGNPRPQLCLIDALLESVTPIGGGRHLRMRASKFGKSYECVMFSQTYEELGLNAGDRVDVAFFPQINRYRTRSTVQLLVTDIRLNDALPLCRKILAGAPLSGAEAADILPQSQDFARTWRRLRAVGGRVTGSLSDVLRRIDFHMYPARLCVCLAVFEELELLTINRFEEEFEIVQCGAGKKTDLGLSRILRELRACNNDMI